MEELKAGNRRLTAEVKALSELVEKLDNDFVDYKTTVRKRATGFVVVLALVAMAAGTAIFAVVRQNDLTESVLCPYFKLIVNSYNPTGPSARAQGVEEYNRNFAEVRKQYRVLDCRESGKRHFERHGFEFNVYAESRL